MTRSTYSVPKGLFVVLVSLSPKILDKPKSEIFGTLFSSSNIFSGFRSKCNRDSPLSLWRYFKPSHIPLIILYRICHSRPQDSSAVIINRNIIRQPNTNIQPFYSMTLKKGTEAYQKYDFAGYHSNTQSRVLCVSPHQALFFHRTLYVFSLYHSNNQEPVQCFYVLPL